MDFVVDPGDHEIIRRAAAEAGHSSNVTWGQKNI